jgi:hypothetical protein
MDTNNPEIIANAQPQQLEAESFVIEEVEKVVAPSGDTDTIDLDCGGDVGTLGRDFTCNGVY